MLELSMFLGGVALLYGFVGFLESCCSRLLSGEKISENETIQIAVHEAGHLILCSMLSRIPYDMTAFIFPRENPNKSRGGVVNAPELRHFKCSSDCCDFYLVMLLGGMIGEEIFLGLNSVNSNSDISRWEGYARNFLLHQGRDRYFFYQPRTSAEAELNQKELKGLMEDKKAIARAVISENKMVFEADR